MPYVLGGLGALVAYLWANNAAENIADRVLPPKNGLTIGQVALVMGAVIGSLYLAKRVGIVK